MISVLGDAGEISAAGSLLTVDVECLLRRLIDSYLGCLQS